MVFYLGPLMICTGRGFYEQMEAFSAWQGDTMSLSEQQRDYAMAVLELFRRFLFDIHVKGGID